MPKNKESLSQAVSKFFKRVQNQDLISLGDNKINVFNSPQTREEQKLKRELQVFRQYLQNKNWNLKHIEYFDEYRRMDTTFPVINAALRLYAQEVCLTGDCIIETPQGPITILEQYRKKSNYIYVKSYNTKMSTIQFTDCNGIKSNGIKDVYEVIVQRNIDVATAETDKIEIAKFKCTDNHKILLPDRTYKELKDLSEGDQIFGYFESKDPSCGCLVNKFVATTILSIKHVGQEEVFDLINVGSYHNFAIKLTDSFRVIVHNCNKDSEGNIFKIVTDDLDVKRELYEVFYDNLKLETKSYLIVKALLKFGNCFAMLETRRGEGVVNIWHLPPEAIRIMMIPNSDKLDDFKYQWYGYGGNVEFEPWQIVHWKIIEDIEHEPYGQSILRSIVDTWRRIVLMREALIIYRITRAPQKFLFKIDTSNMDPDAARLYAEEMKKSLQKKPLVDNKTGEMDFKYNALSITDDYYMPTYEGDVGGIEVLEGANNLDMVEDYKIIKDDLYAGLLIPKSYLTFEEDLCLKDNTILLTTEGKITIKELSELYEKDAENFNVSVCSYSQHGFIVTGKVEWCKPTKLVNELYKVTLSNGKIVETTDNHPYLTEEFDYVRADELKIGMKIRNIHLKDIWVENIEIIKLEEPEYVYDLEVSEYHNFALESGIFVHNSNKAALSQEDLRFNNAIKQYQSYFIEGLLHIALVHLYLKGYNKEDLESFSIEMNGSSTLAEKAKNELLQQRIELAKSALEAPSDGIPVMSYTQVLSEILKFSDDEIQKVFENQLVENKIIFKLKKIKEEGFYEEPDPAVKKANMKTISGGEDIFKDLQFESKSLTSSVRDILSKKIEKEVEWLKKPIKAKPTKKLIESVINLCDDGLHLTENVLHTMKDLGVNLSFDEDKK